MNNRPDFLSIWSASRKAPVTSPNCISNFMLAMVCNTVNLPFDEIVGDCVRPSRINEKRSGSLSPRAVHLALTISLPESSHFVTRTILLGTILSASCCLTIRDSSMDSGRSACLSSTTFLTSFRSPLSNSCLSASLDHLLSLGLISFLPLANRTATSSSPFEHKEQSLHRHHYNWKGLQPR